MARRVLAVIPARLGSKRFSDKVIYPFNGKPLLYYVHREALKAKTITRVVIATDSEKIIAAAQSFGARAIRTSRRHQTGSDRVAEVARELGGDIIVNIQADNFGLKGSVLDHLVNRMIDDSSIRFATLARKIKNDNELFSPDLVKVIVARDNTALWFSRYPLPYIQHAGETTRCSQFPFLGHIGVYGFRRKALAEYSGWARTRLEKAESLEQLRIIENGGRIKVFRTAMDSVEINSPNDLKKLKRIYK
ncbi:MAG: 3-deoxy-manno-octulosonate cytidylyltransferase [Candidatus Zixiibacteriota bacterium]|nr:MAG: 3-deoxy-manno-octulosonate cytidylyltransferase [candidate division Zixibacteria bacterium]